MKEYWKDVLGYNGFYRVSNYGNVKSVTRKIKCGLGGVCERTWIGKTLTPVRIKVGCNTDYYQVALSRHGIIKRFSVHRLVAIAFIPNPNCKLEVNHKDGNGLNNYISNLDWVTRSENAQHAVDNHLYITAKGTQKASTKLREIDIPKIRNLIKKGFTIGEIGKLYKVHGATIYAIKIGYTWKHVP